MKYDKQTLLEVIDVYNKKSAFPDAVLANLVNIKGWKGHYNNSITQEKIRIKDWKAAANRILSRYLRDVSDRNPPKVVWSEAAYNYNPKVTTIKKQSHFNKLRGPKKNGHYVLYWEHMIPLEDIINKITRQPNRLDKILGGIIIAIITSEENTRLNKVAKTNRPNPKYIYEKVGIKIK